MKVPLLDLAPYHARLRDRVSEALMRVYDSGTFITGTELERFERELSRLVDDSEVVGVSSGTDALVASLLCLGIGAGSTVVTTPFSFFATASAIRATGARVHFCDIEKDGVGLDPEALSPVLPHADAVIAVHLYGVPCAVDRIAELCLAGGVPLVEDGAQALGARLGGKSVGTFGQLGCFSFFPAKSLGALGDAGCVVTKDSEQATRLRRIRAHGASRKHEHVEHGGNYRLDEMQAAVLRLKLRDFPHRVAANRRHARYYDDAFGDLVELLPNPRPPEASCSLYTLRVVERRDELATALERDGIGTQVHYPRPLHLQPALRELGHASGDFPRAEQRAREVLSIPLYPEMTDAQREYVCERVRAFFR